MRVFITGGTGFIGSAVVAELLAAGHEVVGLARSQASAQTLEQAGAEAWEGALDDLDRLQQGADAADATIHAAFVHNFADFAAAVETDRRAIVALGQALAGSNRPLVVTSGVPLGEPGQVVTEATDADPARFPRLSEAAALPFARQGVRVSAVRPSRLVHGPGDRHGFVPQLIAIARQSGQSAHIGDGHNRVQAVHRLDVAALFRLAVERGTAGARYQAVADGGLTFRRLALAIAQRLGVPAVSIPASQAQDHFGFLGQIVAADNPASSEETRQTLGWAPTHPSLLQDLASDVYFLLNKPE
ncbi:MAG: SDR family oxidoreductase [Propionibacteriaceae bacterium]|jgi:nucleoside-diphosphate-sugar epimerase|nr:SDR family oxidoreductase [Propionibacteriaceae bacterium]